MNKISNIFCLLMLLTLSGCRYSFELNDSDMEPMIAVRASICADSTTQIKVHKTIPMTKIDKIDTVMTAPFYTLRCNGEEVETSDIMDGEGGMQITSGAFRSGDRLELTFGAEGMETTVSKTVVPAAFPKYDITSSAAQTLTISYEDSKGYYGVRILWKGKKHQFGDIDDDGNYNDIIGTEEYIDGAKPTGSYDSISLDPGAYSPNVIHTEVGYIFFWCDDEAEDNSYEVRFKYLYDYETGSYTEDGVELKCVLYSFSEEMYRTINAYFDIQNNPLANLGLSSPSFTYSNVRNGLGYFGGYTKTETEWFPATKEDKK